MQFNRLRAARVLSDAVEMGDGKAAEKWKITTRSIENYRKRLATDAELSGLFGRLRQRAMAEWQGSRIRTLKAGLAKIEELVEKATEPSELPLVVNAVKVVGELQVTAEALGGGDADTIQGADAAALAAGDGETEGGDILN